LQDFGYPQGLMLLTREADRRSLHKNVAHLKQLQRHSSRSYD
jgi:hypothetical protein